MQLSYRVFSGPVVDSLSNFNSRLDAQLSRQMDRIGQVVARTARDIVPVRTGALRSSIDYTAGRTLGSVRVSASMPYAAFVELGTRPHMILPKHGKFLVFRVINGAVIYRRQVSHPGTKPYKYLARALQRNQSNIRSLVDQAVKAALKG